MKKINIIEKYYNFHLNKYKSGPKAVNWSSYKSQVLRFNKILEAGDFNKKKISVPDEKFEKLNKAHNSNQEAKSIVESFIQYFA